MVNQPIGNHVLGIFWWGQTGHNTLYVTLQPCPVREYTALRRNL